MILNIIKILKCNKILFRYIILINSLLVDKSLIRIVRIFKIYYNDGESMKFQENDFLLSKRENIF